MKAARGFIAFVILVLMGVTGAASAQPGTPGVAIFGTDDRRAMDTSRLPWSAIGRLEFEDGFCSGALISEDVVLTAAHCVVREGALDASAGFVTARGRADGPLTARMVEVRVLPGLDRGGEMGAALTRNGDWALVRLDRPLGAELGYLGVEAAADNRPRRPDLIGAIAMIAVAGLAAAASAGRSRLVFAGLAGLGVLILMGFAAPPALAPDWRRIPIAQAGYSWDAAGVLTGVEACRIVRFRPSGLIEHDCDIAFGDSGSPLLVRREDRWAIIAVVSHTVQPPGAPPRAWATAARAVPDPGRAFSAPGRPES